MRQGGLLGTGDVEVLVDTNAKKAYEAWYWKGLLDAQGNWVVEHHTLLFLDLFLKAQ